MGINKLCSFHFNFLFLCRFINPFKNSMLMMTYFSSFGLMILILTIIYWWFPKKFFKTDTKNEYISYALFSISSFWVLYMLSRIWTDELINSPGLSMYLLFVWSTFVHLIYPFKTMQRNRYFTFISVGFTVISILLTLIVWVSVLMTDTM